MSRAYYVDITVTKYNTDHAGEIADWIDSHVGEDTEIYADTFLPMINYAGVVYLGGGRSEEEWAQEVTESIWGINEAYCIVGIRLIYLEDNGDYVELDEEDYDEWRATKEEGGADDADQ